MLEQTDGFASHVGTSVVEQRHHRARGHALIPVRQRAQRVVPDVGDRVFEEARDRPDRARIFELG